MQWINVRRRHGGSVSTDTPSGLEILARDHGNSRFHTASVRTGKVQAEQYSSAVTSIADVEVTWRHFSEGPIPSRGGEMKMAHLWLASGVTLQSHGNPLP